MFDQRHFEQHRSIFSEAGPGQYREEWGRHHVDLRPKDLLRWIELCRDDLGYLVLLDIVAVDRRRFKGKWGHSFELVYLLFNMSTHQNVDLHVHLNEGETVPSVATHFTHGQWPEREQAELLGIHIQSNPGNLLLSSGEKVKPLRKDAKLGEWVPYSPPALPKLRINPNKSEAPYPEESWVWKNFDLFSPETLGNFEWQLCFDPAKVVDSRVEVGLHHRGIEKLFEEREWKHIIHLVDLLEAGAAPTYSTIWVRGLEEMLGIKLTERAQAVRIVLLELARVSEHLTVMFEVSSALRRPEAVLLIDAREKVFELFEKYCGHRQGLGVMCLGGVREDLPHGWISEYQIVANLLLKNLKIINRSLLSQHDFRSSLDSGGVNAQTVLQWGIGGPAMRAAGVNFDLRKSRPFYFYQDIDFDVPVGIHGTSYDRFLIRFEEINQSLRIITQVLDNLPLGEVRGPEDEELAGNLGSLKGKWHYSCIESPNGEAGLVFLCGKDAAPYRLKVKSPSFMLAQGLGEFVLGLEEGQVAAAVASLGIRKTELDR